MKKPEHAMASSPTLLGSQHRKREPVLASVQLLGMGDIKTDSSLSLSVKY